MVSEGTGPYSTTRPKSVYFDDPALDTYFTDRTQLDVQPEWSEPDGAFFVLCSLCGMWDHSTRLQRTANQEARSHQGMHKSGLI